MRIFFFGPMAWIGWLLGASILSCVSCVALFISGAGRRRLGVAMLVLIGATVFLQMWGGQVTRYVRFRLLKATYESQVLAPGSSGGLRTIRDPGPPERTAFPWPGGILDNWCGVVYDPTRALDALARPKKLPRDHPLRELFGGDIIGVEHLEGPWYFCWFT